MSFVAGSGVVGAKRLQGIRGRGEGGGEGGGGIGLYTEPASRRRWLPQTSRSLVVTRLWGSHVSFVLRASAALRFCCILSVRRLALCCQRYTTVNASRSGQFGGWLLIFGGCKIIS